LGQNLSEINKTQLDIERAEDRGIIHRDYAAHYFRWSYALRWIDYQSTVLDLGCANGMLAQVLYVNKYKPKLYAGIDVRWGVLEQIKERHVNFPVELHNLDLRHKQIPYPDKTFSNIVSFEMIEHITAEWLPHILEEAKRVLKDDGVFLLSTPNFNGSAAANHIHEYKEAELRGYLEKFFKIAHQFGTFASKPDIYPVLTESERQIYDRLWDYYDNNVMSNIFAPLYPHQSRNILWILTK